MRRLLLTAALLCLTACATVGKPIAMDQVSNIHEGVTTTDEVFELLGKPQHVTVMTGNVAVITYQHVHATAFGHEAQVGLDHNQGQRG